MAEIEKTGYTERYIATFMFSASYSEISEEDFASLSPELVAHFSDLFSVPEMLVSIDGQLTVLPC